MREDHELIYDALQGDQDAFAQLVERYQRQVYSLALRMVGQEQDALDLTQEAFVRAWRALAGFRADARFSTWLYRLTSNLCIDFLRSRKHQRGHISLSTPDQVQMQRQIPDPAPLPEERALQWDRERTLRRAMEKLSPEQRQILILRAVSGLSYAEIAQIMDLKEGTVKSRLARTREQLRQILLAEGNYFPTSSSKQIERGEG